MWTRRSGSHPRYRTPTHKQARATLLKAYTQATPAAYAVDPCTHPPTYSTPTTYPVPTPTVA